MIDIKKDRILAAARAVFLRYGYRRVSMQDIAEAAGVSRPALYVLFKNKEEIFIGVFMHWVAETLACLTQQMGGIDPPRQKLLCAFEAWTVRPFEMMMRSPEAKELIDGGFPFAQDSLRQGYAMFEAAIAPVVAMLAACPATALLAPAQIAHVLASATRGFKQTATTAAELRRLIESLLLLTFGPDSDTQGENHG